MISLEQYWMGRKAKYANELTQTIESNANETVRLANMLIEASGMDIDGVNSGWRPNAINKVTAGAAKASKHLTGEAVDLTDPRNAFGEWCLTTLGRHWMTKIGLWMEHPSKTIGWCHLQIVPPKSGNRVFFP